MIPRKTRIGAKSTRATSYLLRALGGFEERRRAAVRFVLAEPGERRHRRARVHARRALEVGDLEGDALVLRALGGQVRARRGTGRRRRGRCGSSRQPETANSFAPATASGCPVKPCFFAHAGTCAISSEPSASFAVAPLYVRMPIERTTRIDATIATGRRSRPPLGADVDERHRDQQHRGRASGCRSCRGSPCPAT